MLITGLISLYRIDLRMMYVVSALVKQVSDMRWRNPLQDHLQTFFQGVLGTWVQACA
jgi:predicted unusual protein kinase regulating ubiquinone biosynthesis (AarF/ABC1/UbiB family)